jgi:serine/threonine-protein phosphatase 5
MANMALGNFKEGLKDFRTVYKAAPNDADAKRNMSECEKIIRKMEFEKAITTEHSLTKLVDTVDFNAIVVEASYQGPRFDTETITEVFLHDMIGYMRQQKMIHRKYAYKVCVFHSYYFSCLSMHFWSLTTCLMRFYCRADFEARVSTGERVPERGGH